MEIVYFGSNTLEREGSNFEKRFGTEIMEHFMFLHLLRQKSWSVVDLCPFSMCSRPQ